MKGITIQKVSETKARVKFRIDHQTHRGEDFGYSKQMIVGSGPRGNAFKAKNGIVLASCGSPENYLFDKVLFVRGAKRSFDKVILEVTKTQYKKITEAINEYNKLGGYTRIVDFPDDLFKL